MLPLTPPLKGLLLSVFCCAGLECCLLKEIGNSEYASVAANSKLIYESMKECDIRLVSALPATWLVHLIRTADEDPETILVRLAKEEEGVDISAGAYFAGVKSAMLM